MDSEIGQNPSRIVLVALRTQVGYSHALGLSGMWAVLPIALTLGPKLITTLNIDAWNAPNFSTEIPTPWATPQSQANQEGWSPYREAGQITHWLLKLLSRSKTQHFCSFQWLKQVTWPQRTPRGRHVSSPLYLGEETWNYLVELNGPPHLLCSSCPHLGL